MNDDVAALFDPGNGWSARTRERLTDLPPELAELVLHLATSDVFWNWRYKVDTPWKRRTKALLKADGADGLVRHAVRELAAGGSFHDQDDPDRVIRELGQLKPASPARPLAIGFLLAAGWLRADTDGLSADLALVARKNSQAMDTYHRVDHDIAGAAFTALGDLPGPDAMEQLWDLHYRIPTALHPRKVLVKSVKRAAARLGIPAHEIAERTVPRHGLEADGTMTVGWIGRGVLWWNASVDAVVTLHDTGTVTVDWSDGGGPATRTTAPFRTPNGYRTPMRADCINLVRRYAQDIGKTLAAERIRLESLAGDADRTWSWRDWSRYYRDHPVTGVVTRSLAWEYRLPGEETHRPLDPAAAADAVPATARVRLRPAAAG
ncbi:hypothetical protein HYE82_24745 [Streptomyces sp. BR123]|uniref:DUF4132 domain-containing protein n=1 Tax=Streptomyces sp. BR123 TaxID=2749828 RepID=UPI0015C49C88|nr:DUF4132 domain-containing protein [Streptomyces sp. BR123]NXY97525.1 hypothetical protein [Streptomyces sp. BR123]